jgi:hypothetical protein
MNKMMGMEKERERKKGEMKKGGRIDYVGTFWTCGGSRRGSLFLFDIIELIDCHVSESTHFTIFVITFFNEFLIH